MGGDHGDGAFAVAVEAARALGVDGLSAAEREWLEDTGRDLRRLLPSHESRVGRQEMRDDDSSNDASHLEFVKAALASRPQSASTYTNLPPLPTLPLGSRILPVAELKSHSIDACVSDLTSLWCESRKMAKKDTAMDSTLVTQTSASLRAGICSTSTPANEPEPGEANKSYDRMAPVVPFALCGRLRLSPLKSLSEPKTEDDSSGTSLVLEDTSGTIEVALVGIPDVRLIGKRVLAVAWSKPKPDDKVSKNLKKNTPPTKESVVVEVTRFICLDSYEQSVLDATVTMPEVFDSAVPPPPPPKPSLSYDVCGSVCAVSPLVRLRDEDNLACFFLVELGGPCVYCIRNQSDTQNVDPWRRRVVFTGETLAQWRPFFGGSMGGWVSETAQTSQTECVCVKVTDLRATSLFKGEGDHELRVSAATSATKVVPIQSKVPSSMAQKSHSHPYATGCMCPTCVVGDTVSKLEAYVVAEDPAGLGVLISGRCDGVGLPLLMTHAVISPARNGERYPSLRIGSKIAVTHAHPVAKSAHEQSVSEEREARENSDESEPRSNVSDDWGLRAVGACLRTRVHVVSVTPLAVPVPVLFSENQSISYGYLPSPRSLQKQSELVSFSETEKIRSLALLLAKRLGEKEKENSVSKQERKSTKALISDLVCSGKRKRNDPTDQRSSLSIDPEEETNDPDVSDARAKFLNAILDPTECPYDTNTKTIVSDKIITRLSLYHEFFTPIALGGDQVELPNLPSVAEVVRRSARAFTEAANEDRKNKSPNSKNDIRLNTHTTIKRVPFGVSIGATRSERLVVDGNLLFGKRNQVLLGWVGCTQSGRQISMTLGDSKNDTNRNSVHLEIDDVSVDETIPTGSLCVLKRYTVFCEGVGVSDTLQNASQKCRVHVRVSRGDFVVIDSGSGQARSAYDKPNRFSLSPAPRSVTGRVSDTLVWHKNPLCPNNWPPQPEKVTNDFIAKISKEEKILDDRGGERKLRFTFSDLTGGFDSVDAYCGDVALQNVPVGVGQGSVVVVRGATRHVSANANVYLKLNRNARLFLVKCATSSLSWGSGSDTDRDSRSRIGTSIYSANDTTSPRCATLSELSKNAIESVGLSVDRRAWRVRARVSRVTLLTAKWACLTCGCDAGVMGSANASAAAKLAAERRKARVTSPDEARLTREDGEDSDHEVAPPQPPTDIAGCASCRPPPEQFKDLNALQQHTQSMCGFEVEVGTTLSDGVCAVDCWISGDAGVNLLPPRIKNAVLKLTKLHGRVTCKFDANALSSGDKTPYLMQGYCGRTIGEQEGACLIATIGFSQRLGEINATVVYNYEVFLDDGKFCNVGAVNSPNPETRIVNCGGVPVAMRCLPSAKLRAIALEPVEAAREAARVLAERKEA